MTSKSNKRGRIAAEARGKRAVEAALTGQSVRSIARDEGVEPRTIERDLRRPAAQAALGTPCRDQQERIAVTLGRALDA